MTRLSELPTHYRWPDSISSRQITQENVDHYDLLQEYLFTHNIAMPEHLDKLYELKNYAWQFHQSDMHNPPPALFLGYSDYEDSTERTILEAETSISIDTIPHTGTILTMAKPITINTLKEVPEKQILTLGYLLKSGLYHAGITIRQSQINSLHGARLLPSGGMYDSLHGLITPAMINALDDPYNEEDPLLFSRAYRFQYGQPPKFNGQSASLNRWYKHAGLIMRQSGLYDLTLDYANAHGENEWSITIPAKLSRAHLLK